MENPKTENQPQKTHEVTTNIINKNNDNTMNSIEEPRIEELLSHNRLLSHNSNYTKAGKRFFPSLLFNQR
jgi:hypothetical protein